MTSKTVTVGSQSGLHVRAATIISEAASHFADTIMVGVVGDEDAEHVDAMSSLMLMSLGAEQGTEVIVSSDSTTAVETVAELLAKNLDDR